MAPLNTALPTLGGNRVLDQTLTVTSGTWTDDGHPVYTYQWEKAYADGSGGYSTIPGQTLSSIVLTDDLQGYKLRCKVTNTDGTGATTAASADTGVWIGAPWALFSDPTGYLTTKFTHPRNGLFYVGDTVSITRVERFKTTDPHWTDFEAGTNGNTISTADAGSHNPFTVAASCVYDNTHVVSGSLSAKIPSATGGNVQFGGLQPFQNNEAYGRMYHYATANPTDTSYPLGGAVLTYINDLQPTIGGRVMSICVNTSGKPLVTGQAAFSTSIPLNQWYRLEYYIKFDSSAGIVTVRLFTGASDTVPAEEHTYTGLNTHTLSASFGYAAIHGVVTGGHWLSDTWMDDLVANSSTWVGTGSPVSPAITNNYEVRDYYGNIVSSGSYNEYTCQPTPPVGGWQPGWYRVYFKGSNNDVRYGQSVGEANFAVLRDNPNFPHLPDGIPGSGDTLSDVIFKAALGATSRLGIDDVTSSTLISQVVSGANLGTTYYTPYSDTHRPRYLWSNAVNQTYDRIEILNGSPAQSYGWIMCKDGTVDGSKVFVTVTAGSSSGTKIKVFYPDAVTLVETFDNLASADAAETAINGVSNYIHFVLTEGLTPNPYISTPTAIGNTYFNAVKNWVSTAYAAGVTHFEGPTNEPTVNTAAQGRREAHVMKMFQAAVHAGNASAKAIGYCPVFIKTDNFEYFLIAGGGDYCDEFAVHTYNAINGDLNQGRNGLQAFKDLLTSYGYGSKPVWQTEATSGPPVVGAFLPHKLTRWLLLDALILEEYGIPREKNNPWYDMSNGFWSFPAFLETNDGSPMPHAVAWRVLAEETYGKPYASKLDFGTPGNNIFIGGTYTDPDDGTSVVCIMPTSALHNGSVTLSISGTSSPLTVVDGMGNQSTKTISSGKVTLDTIYAMPVYVRLPNGASATVFSCNDWNSTAITKVTATSAVVGSTSTVLPNDGLFMNSPYAGLSGNTYVSSGSLPEAIKLTLSAPTEIDRVIIWSGAGWQILTTILKFDIQTSMDGTNWTTVKSVDTTDKAVSFKHGSSGGNTGTQYESYWPEQWVYDESFTPTTASYVRVMVYSASYGGFPDFNSVCGPFRNFGGSPETPYVSVQEMQVFTSSTSAGGGGGGGGDDPRLALYEAPPYNWVFYLTHDGHGAHRKQEGDMVECVGAMLSDVLDRIDEYEANLVRMKVPVSNEWGELYGPTANDRARLYSKG